MSVVAPISATGAAVPVLVGLAEGERPGALQIAGMAAALAGVILASRECEPAEDLGAEHRKAGRAAIGLALVAALGFGTFFVGVDRASATAEVPWVIVISRSCSLVLVLIAALVARPQLPRDPGSLGALAIIGVLDLGATGCSRSRPPRGCCRSSPCSARCTRRSPWCWRGFVLSEQVSRTQGIGIGLTLAGVVAISAGDAEQLLELRDRLLGVDVVHRRHPDRRAGLRLPGGRRRTRSASGAQPDAARRRARRSPGRACGSRSSPEMTHASKRLGKRSRS